MRLRRGACCRIFITAPQGWCARMSLRLRGYRLTHWGTFTRANVAQRALDLG